MSITWLGIKERIERHRARYRRSQVICPSEEEIERLRKAEGEDAVSLLFQNLVGQIIQEERTLTRIIEPGKETPP